MATLRPPPCRWRSMWQYATGASSAASCCCSRPSAAASPGDRRWCATEAARSQRALQKDDVADDLPAPGGWLAMLELRGSAAATVRALVPAPMIELQQLRRA